MATRQQNTAAETRDTGRPAKRYRGVVWVESRLCWFARMDRTHLGQYEREEDAAVAYDRVARHIGLDPSRWNFPLRKLTAASVEEVRRERRAKVKRATSSAYVGVVWDRTNNAWKASLMHEGRTLNLGLYRDEEEAARRYDEVAFTLKGVRAVLNFGVPRGRPKKVSIPRQREPTLNYEGVLRGRNGVLLAIVYEGRRMIYAGRWQTPEEAALARDRALLFLGQGRTKLNFPRKAKEHGPRSPKELRRDALLLRKPVRTTSRYLGVAWNDRDKKWTADVFMDGAAMYLGDFAQERDAAIARDRVWRFFSKDPLRLNFPGLALEPASVEEIRAEVHRVFKESTSSQYRGVSYAKQQRKWDARIQIDGRQHCLGQFDSEEEAAVEYDKAVVRLGAPLERLNFPERRPGASAKRAAS
jgi:hypothetical protein